MKAAGITGSIYTHPIGDQGHGAYPLIGLWDRQQGVPGRGDVLLLPGTWFSIELSATTPVPEWGTESYEFEQKKTRWLTNPGRLGGCSSHNGNIIWLGELPITSEEN